MNEGPAGSYKGTIPAYFGTTPDTSPHGIGHITVTLQCPGGVTITITQDVYFDPSGIVVDVFNEPVAGATVTLYSLGATGTFVPVPDGSSVMSPANRKNPDLTAADGTFGCP